MRDEHGSLFRHHIVKACVDVLFRDGIERTCGLVEYDHRGIAVQRPGECDLLLLASGYLDPLLISVLLILQKTRIDPAPHVQDPLIDAGVLEAFDHPLPVKIGTCRHVFRHREGEDPVILEHDGKEPDILIVIILADVNAV